MTFFSLFIIGVQSKGKITPCERRAVTIRARALGKYDVLFSPTETQRFISLSCDMFQQITETIINI